MQTYGLIIIGSGPAGISAATAYQKGGGQGPVLLLSADTHEPYQRPPLSKNSLREQSDPDPTPIKAAQRLKDVEIRYDTTVTALDPQARTVTAGGETVGFERVVLAPGSRPLTLPNADEDAEVQVLRTYADLERLHEAAGHARSALVVGSGFIGCEAAVSLAQRGIEVALVSQESAPQVERLGERAAALITELLEGYGIELHLGTEVTGLRTPRTVHLSDGRTLEPDLILLAVGVEPATDFLSDSGLQLHEGRVVVDEQLRSTAEGVYAAGDAARAMNTAAGRPVSVEHWGDALTMGRLAGANAAGGQDGWDSVPGFWSEIGEHTLKYAAWGDGFDATEVVEGPGSLTVWYGRDGDVVGVLTYNADADYERGEQLITQGASLEAAARGDRPETGDEEETEGDPES